MENSHGFSQFNRPMQINQPIQNDDSYFSPFPPGYRFLPTDAELVVHYLAKKICNQPLQSNRIVDVELYKFHPEELSKKKIKGDDSRELYFFTPRDRKYPNGSRPSRSASTGYWKATGKDKVVVTNDNIRVGYKKSLVFFEGKPPRGTKTKWLMHEYRLDNLPERQRAGPHDMRLDDWVLCKIYPKENKKRSEDVNDDEHVEESVDEGNFLRSKKRKEREEANSESPETMIPQNIDNYGDAGGEMPRPPPLEQTHVHGPCKAFNHLGEIMFPVEEDEDNGVLIRPFEQVHVHSPCTTFQHPGEILIPIEEDDEDNGQDQNGLISNGGQGLETLNEGGFDFSNGSEGLETLNEGGFDFSNVGQGLETLDGGGFHFSNGSEGLETLNEGGFDFSNVGQGLETHDGGDFHFSNGSEGLEAPDGGNFVFSNGGQELEALEGGDFNLSNGGQGLISNGGNRGQGLEALEGGDFNLSNGGNDGQGLEALDGGNFDFSNGGQGLEALEGGDFNLSNGGNDGQGLEALERGDFNLSNALERGDFNLSNGGNDGHGLEALDGGNFDFSNGGQGLISNGGNGGQRLEALEGGDFYFSNGSEGLEAFNEGESDDDLGLDLLDYTKWGEFLF